MFITIRKNNIYRNSYLVLLYNNKRRIIKKLGVIAFNKKLNTFVFTCSFIQILILFSRGIYLDYDFYKNINKIVNSFKI